MLETIITRKNGALINPLIPKPIEVLILFNGLPVTEEERPRGQLITPTPFTG